MTDCTASIHHGPGHQSKTACGIVGAHTVHVAVYGSYDETAYWDGNRDVCGRRVVTEIDRIAPPEEAA